MNADIFVFKIVLHNNRKVFYSFPIAKEHQGASMNELAEETACFCV